jgi:hypothetical protein
VGGNSAGDTVSVLDPFTSICIILRCRDENTWNPCHYEELLVMPCSNVQFQALTSLIICQAFHDEAGLVRGPIERGTRQIMVIDLDSRTVVARLDPGPVTRIYGGLQFALASPILE